MRLQLVEPALVVKRYNSGRKRTISDVKQYKRDWFKRHKRVFLEDKIFQLCEIGHRTDEGSSDRDFVAHFCVFLNVVSLKSGEK